jgi:small subunit ribosomal protein S6
MDYELAYIIPAKFTEDDVPKINHKITRLILDSGGQIINEESWGKRKLAYPIKQNKFGYYQILKFALDPLVLQKIEHQLKLDSSILRYMTIKVKYRTTTEKEKKRAELKKVEEKKIEEKKIEKPKVEKVKKISIEDLDEKLEEILKDDVVK